MRNLKLGLQFNRKITKKVIVQKHWLKSTKSRYNLTPGGCSPVEEMVMLLLKVVVLWKSLVLLWISSGSGQVHVVPPPGHGVSQWSDIIL